MLGGTLHILVQTFLRGVSLQSGKLQGDCSTIKQKMNLFFQVNILKFTLTIYVGSDEIKWGLRLPENRAVRERALDYEDKV